MTRHPVSTYRIQFHNGYQLSDALRELAYLRSLGIGDLYASPLLAARAGSMHGYDVVDPGSVNPEVGGEDAFRELVDGLHAHGMGLLLDIVPNHMAASLENPWWRDVLRHGRKSAYATFFDIDWDSRTPGLAGKVLLPVLGGPFRDVLEAGDLKLDYEDGEYVIRYYENAFPVSPETSFDDPERAVRELNGTPGDPASFDALEKLIRAQHYRLAYWRVAASTINYRRFFDVSELVSLRAEDREVFEATHRQLLEFARDGAVTGLRIDHIDGLRDPAGYLEWLAEALPGQDGDFYVVVEKILAADEDLPGDWRTAGTSGYDALNTINGVFVDRRSISDLDRTYARLRGSASDFEELVHERKKQVMAELFPGDIRELALSAWEIAATLRAGIDLTLDEMEQAIIEVIAHFQVYRTYTRSPDVSDSDRARIEAAVEAAAERRPDLERALSVFASIALLDLPDDATDTDRWLAFVVRWQQFTGPIMAKGFEDTSLYVYNRLISLNEVGGEPDPAGVPLSDFHRWAAHRQEHWPGGLTATSTHDTKRSEDVRARINVLSELAPEWDAALARWQELNGEKKTWIGGSLAPDGNEDHLIYHSMLGAWPFDRSDVPDFRERLKQYLLKASREAKTHTSWLDQNSEYEDALTGFIDRIIIDDPDDPFMQDFHQLLEPVSFHGALNSLSQTLLKIGMPGVPDFYQGTELWDLSLVDPDNRRPVDYSVRAAMLESLQASDDDALVRSLLENWTSGAVKLYLIWKALGVRGNDPELFTSGQYIPVHGVGEEGRHVVAFARSFEGRWALFAAPRLTVSLARMKEQPTCQMPLGQRFWGDATLELPARAPNAWRNVLTGERLETTASGTVQHLALSAVFSRFPSALLLPEDSSRNPAP